jgi:hypothetical protein
MRSPSTTEAKSPSHNVGLAFLDFALSFAGEILKLPTCGLKGVADSHVDIVVGIRNVWIPVDYDIGGPGYRKMNLYLIGVALVVPMLRPADNHAYQGDSVRERLELLPVITDAGLDGVGMLDVFERDLKWNLHC